MNTENIFQPAGRDESIFPISFAQQRLWFLHQLDPQSAAYNMALPLRLRGELNVIALQNALNEIVLRHEPLRTTFQVIEGETMQVIAPSASLKMSIMDLSCLPESEREEKAMQWIGQDAKEPFDLSRDLMARAQLLRLNSTEHILALTLHHIAADGWSIEVLFREMATLYRDFSEQRPASLPNLSIQYADFAVWQRQSFQGEVLRNHLEYWKAQLANVPDLLEFPTDRPRPPIQLSSRGAQSLVTFDQTLTSALKNLSRREGCSLYMTLLTAFQILTMRYTGQEDIVLGSPLGIRQPETERLIGCFINTVVVRADLSGNPTFHELLGKVKNVVIDALEHGDVPLDRLVEELKVPRHAGRNPLFQVLFQVLCSSGTENEFFGLNAQPMWPVENNTAKFDLTFTLEERRDEMLGQLEYNTDLFDRATIERLLSHYQILLESIVANPNQRIGDLPLLSADEKRKFLVEWNNTGVSYPKNISISELFEKQVEVAPDSIAVIFEEQQLTYRELNRRANQLARHLIKLGVGADMLVGICLDRSMEMVVAIFGVLKAGGAYVPLDPDYPEERLRFMLNDAQATVLLTQKNFAERFHFKQNNVLCLDSDWQTISREAENNLDDKPGGDHLAYVIYTSGSTGQPKGVMISHGAICNHMQWMQGEFPLDKTDRVLQKTPFSFDASVWEFFAPLLNGAQLVLAKPGGHRDSAYLAKMIAEKNITILQVVPSVLRVLLEEPEFKNENSLRRLFCGGEKLLPEMARRFADISNATLCNLYGPTEATIDATFHVVASDHHFASSESSAPHQQSSIPIGRPISNTQIYILDKQLQPAPIGVPGELCIGGRGLARGYWRRPELTAERFIRDPFSDEPEARLYKTGDLCRFLPNGQIEYLGRIDHQVKVRGFRIELEEIESVLRGLPGVRESVVMAREDAAGEIRLVAYVVCPEKPRLNDELRADLKAKLPEYMVPAAFVTLDVLPLMPNGKVDRKALPDPEFAPDASQFVAPRNTTEEQLAKIWSEVLQIKKVGVHDNFFELGGHSLLATQVVSRMRSLNQKDVPLRDFFSAPTIAGVSALMENSTQLEILFPPISRLSRKSNALVAAAGK